MTETEIIEKYANEIYNDVSAYNNLNFDALKYKLRLLYREAEKNNSDRASKLGAEREVIKNFDRRNIFGKIQDSIGKPILLVVKINHFKGDTNTKSYTILQPETLGLELDQMKATIIHALGNYNEEISKAVDYRLKEAIENFDYKGTITRVANEIIIETIKDYFTYGGAGKKLIEESVTQALDNIFKANAQHSGVRSTKNQKDK